MSISSPNMNLPVPVVETTSGPQYATDINGCLSIIDQHDHTPGNGVAVTPGGLNINSDLTFQDNSATSLKSAVFTAQPSLATLLAIYFIGDDLYVNDGSGNAVRITQSGGVAGSPGSIANLASPASASYVSANQTYVWESDASIAANMDFGAAIFRNLTPNSTYGVTVSAPAALGSNYSLVLPTLPASQKFMTLDASGNMGAPWAVDGSTLEVSSNTVQIKDSGVTTAKINNGAVTQAKRAALGQQVSSSSGTFSTSSASLVDVTNLSVTITTTGRPVFVGMISDGTGNQSNILSSKASSSSTESSIAILRDSTEIARELVGQASNATALGGSISVRYPVSAVSIIDTPSSGTYTYKVQAGSPTASSTTGVRYAKLIAYEL